ncbi:MAG: MerR family transcriptional regulator [Candidatus Omnitrophica bacterium]|nr:MerR family transcriptional regulator [Candidatus Omnitrophota bacterium]
MNTVKLSWTDHNTRFASLQEISKIFDLSYQTLNYYTSIGLIKPQKRQGNKRLYLTKEVTERLRKVTKLKNEGYPLQVISNILNNGQDVKNELF